MSYTESERMRRRAEARARAHHRRLIALGVLVLVAGATIAVIVTLVGGGASHRGGTTPAAANAATGGGTRSGARRLATLKVRAIGQLPAAVQDPAIAALGGDRYVLLGGLTAADSSSTAITVASGGRVQSTATIARQHDAAAVGLDGRAYAFGGADFQQYDHILRFDPAAHTIQTVGRLPDLESDVAAAALNGTAYVVGGFNGTRSLDTIVAWAPGQTAHVVAHLPVALRYPAVAAADGQIIVAGGSTPSGAASTGVYSFTPASGAVRTLGHLSTAVTHAGAAAPRRTGLRGGRPRIGARHPACGDRGHRSTQRSHRQGRAPGDPALRPRGAWHPRGDHRRRRALGAGGRGYDHRADRVARAALC